MNPNMLVMPRDNTVVVTGANLLRPFVRELHSSPAMQHSIPLEFESQLDHVPWIDAFSCLAQYWNPFIVANCLPLNKDMSQVN